MHDQPRQIDSVERLDRPLSLVVQVETALRKAIAERSFPGGKLPSEVELAEGFGVSRETVRRAAEVLQAEGLLRKYRRRGTLVATASPPSALVWPAAGVRTVLGYVVAQFHAPGGEREGVATGVTGMMLHGAVDAASELDCDLIVRSVAPALARSAVEQLVARQGIRGAVLTSLTDDKPLRRLGGRDLALVLLDHDLNVPRLASIRDDSELTSRLAVEHLAALGHREIGYVHWKQAELNVWRLRGYRGAMLAAKLRRRTGYEWFADITPAAAAQAVAHFLSLSERPTALIAFNNTLARWLIDELQRRQVRVPHEISVVGCGGEEVANLTTCQTDWYAMGQQAVQMLHERLADPEQKPCHLRVAPELRVGISTAAKA